MRLLFSSSPVMLGGHAGRWPPPPASVSPERTAHYSLPCVCVRATFRLESTSRRIRSALLEHERPRQCMLDRCMVMVELSAGRVVAQPRVAVRRPRATNTAAGCPESRARAGGRRLYEGGARGPRLASMVHSTAESGP